MVSRVTIGHSQDIDEILNALVMLGYLPINEGKEPRPGQPMLLKNAGTNNACRVEVGQCGFLAVLTWEA